MWRQGTQAYQTSWESWPGYRGSTYMVGELSKATVEVICSPCPGIIGKIFQNPGDAGMYIITVARLRLDTTYSTTDWNEQNRRKQDNSWLTTLPFDVDDTDHHTPPPQGSDISSKHLKYYWDDYLVLNNYTSFTQMLSLTYIYIYIYISLHHSPNMFLIPHHLRIFQHIEQYQHGNCRILANGMRIWHLECCTLHPSNFGQKTSIQLP